MGDAAHTSRAVGLQPPPPAGWRRRSAGPTGRRGAWRGWVQEPPASAVSLATPGQPCPASLQPRAGRPVPQGSQGSWGLRTPAYESSRKHPPYGPPQGVHSPEAQSRAACGQPGWKLKGPPRPWENHGHHRGEETCLQDTAVAAAPGKGTHEARDSCEGLTHTAYPKARAESVCLTSFGAS